MFAEYSDIQSNLTEGREGSDMKSKLCIYEGLLGERLVRREESVWKVIHMTG